MLNVNSWINCAAKGNIMALKESLQFYSGQQDDEGTTALMAAAQHGHIQCVKILMQYELDLVNNMQETAYDIAQKHNQHEIATYLADAKSPGTEAYMQANKARWFEAAETNDIDFLKQNYRFYIKSRDLRPGKQKQTGLMTAARNGAIDALKLLKQQEQGMRDGKGKTALMYAAEYSQVQAVNELFSASIQSDELFDENTYQDIQENENQEQKNDLSELNNDQKSPKIEYIGQNNKEQVKQHGSLNNKTEQQNVGPEVGLKDDYDWCALMYAVDANCVDAVRILAQDQTEYGNKNVFHIGALEIAAQRNFNEVRDVLLQVRHQ